MCNTDSTCVTENGCNHNDGRGHNHGHKHSEKFLIFRLTFAFLLFILILAFKPSKLLEIILFVVAFTVAGYDIVFNAFKNLMLRHFADENFLMTIAALGAFGIGEYHEALMVMILYQTGEALCHSAVEKSRKSISDLMDIKPEFANVLKDETILKTSPDKVKPGETIIVRPGEKIPLDGTVIEGFAYIDTSNLTGESVPLRKNTGDNVLSGSVNTDGVLKIKVTKEFGKSAVSKILDMIENAAAKKAKTENFITKFAKIYTPVVVCLAIFLAVLPPLFFGGFIVWFKRALVFLVISCPCALVISVPLSFFAGIGRASESGILIKGSCYLDALSRAKTVVFDKTGTLTEGVFKVAGIYPAISRDTNTPVVNEQELLKIAACAEIFSNHPVAQSLKSAYGKEINHNDVSDVHEIAGKGVLAKVSGDDIIIGNFPIMEMYNITCENVNSAGTIVYVARNKQYLGYIEISDTVKNGAKIAIDKLYTYAKIRTTVMLTGDNKNAALKIANILGINKVHYNLLPDEKVKITEELLETQKPGETLIFVGDGVNDAPVLTRADVGIAMGALGSDAAIEACDVVITDDKLEKIPEAIMIAKKTMSIVKQNIAFVLVVKFLFLALGAFGFVSMWGAVFADVGVSILAVFNALRIRAFNGLISR